MKCYALVILPPEFRGASDDALRKAVQQRMEPFGQERCEAEDRVARWDYFWCCTKTWLADSDFDASVYPDALPHRELLVIPSHTLTEAGVPAVLVTPDGQWHETAATLRRADPGWPARALAICRSHVGHPAVLAYLHG